ncbi:MAG TPA: hypothetical protein [Caudoviricetes sp.]|nr:MAG TPA: hypothetical protein [Caudoviricetes sp.]
MTGNSLHCILDKMKAESRIQMVKCISLDRLVNRIRTNLIL